MRRLAVFGYGSLVSRDSAAETLGRGVATPLPARLTGFERAWTLGRDNEACEKTFARLDGSLPRHCLGLNLEPADDEVPAPNGALIELSESELERLDLREMRYRRFEVTAAISLPAGGPPPFDAVHAYRARREQHYLSPPEDAIVIANYVRTVDAAFAALGPGQRELFRATTRPAPVEIVEAQLIRDRIPTGNPRGW